MIDYDKAVCILRDTNTCNFNMAKMLSVLLTFILYFLLLSIQSVKPAKIVGYPMIGDSHYIGIKRIAEELVSRGHEVTILVSQIQKIKPTKGITHAIYKVPFQERFVEKVLVATLMKNGILKSALSTSNTSIRGMQSTFCESLLNDTELLNPLKKFDLIITEAPMFCGTVVTDYLDIMRIEYSPNSPRFSFPINPYESVFTLSYVPLYHSNNPGKMTFLQRMKNSLIFIGGQFFFRFALLRSFEKIKQKYDIKSHRSYMKSMDNKELTLFLADFALEYSYPILPSYKLIGPLNIQPVKPLPPDLQQLVDSSGDDGFIIVSFGSNVASILEKEKVDIMAEAFGRLKQKVIWRLQGYIPSSLSPNIKVMEWLPQNDLLAHKNIRVFVSHVGQNSLYESPYRGVPVVALPLYGDQFDNAVLIVERGLGLKLDYQTLTTDDLFNTIQQVIQEPRFKENALRISRLLSDRPRSPAQEAADWIEYTLRNGGLPHLRSYSSQLAWYQYFLVDVFLFLALVVFVMILLIYYTVKFMCWLCCRSREKKVKIH